MINVRYGKQPVTKFVRDGELSRRELAFQHLLLCSRFEQSRCAQFVLNVTSLQLIPAYSN